MSGSSEKLTATELRARVGWPDEALLAECQFQPFRSSGPGGQHRNKVSTAVRLTHQPSGLVGMGSESRSQHENRVRALKRLRETIALEIRAPLSAAPAWPEGVHVHERRLKVSDKNPALPGVIGLVLDALAGHAGRLADAAAWLDISTSSLARFLHEHPKAWAAANAIRATHGQGPIKT